MNFEFFIAKRLVSKQNNRSRFSRPIVTIAVAGIAIGIVVMILSVAIVTGFKKEISQKVIGFGAHLQIVNYDSNTSYETVPISEMQPWLNSLKKIEGIKSINKYILKAGIIKTDEYFQGVVFKGIDNDYNWSFFEQYLKEGEALKINDTSTTNNVLISENTANSLKLKLGDSFNAYFIQDPPRMRKFKIAGIFNTELEEFDKIFIFTDIKHLRKLNNWESDQVSGYEVKINDFDKLLEYDQKLTSLCCNYTPDGSVLKVQNIKDEYPGIFDWLSLLDLNVWVILVLMVIVAGFNMISGLLVIILERVNMIGVIKSMGATNVSIQKIFIYFASYLTIKGLLWGNILGIAICLAQHYFGIATLDPASYYVSVVPINLNIIHILILNIGTLMITILMMILPSFIISKITPADSIRFN